MQFYFKSVADNDDVDFSSTLLFATPTEILEFNFETNMIESVCKFKIPLSAQPLYFSMNDT